MSVVTSGVFVAQTVGSALFGLALLFVLLVVAWWFGGSRRSPRGLNHARIDLPTRWMDVAARLRSLLSTSTSSRAPPIGRPGLLQPLPVSTFAHRRRRERQSDLS